MQFRAAIALLLLAAWAATAVSLDKTNRGQPGRDANRRFNGRYQEASYVDDRGEVSQEALDRLHHVLNAPYHPEQRFAQTRTSASAGAEQRVEPTIVPSWTLPRNPYTAYPFAPHWPRYDDPRFVYPYYSRWPEYLHEYYPRQYNPYYYYRGQYYPAYDHRFYDMYTPSALNPRPYFPAWQRHPTDSIEVGQNPPTNFPQFRAKTDKAAQEAYARAEEGLRAFEADLAGDTVLLAKSEEAQQQQSKKAQKIDTQSRGEQADQDPVTLATARIKAHAITFDDGQGGEPLTRPYPYINDNPRALFGDGPLDQNGQPNPWVMWYGQQSNAARTSTWRSPDNRQQVVEFVEPGTIDSDGSVSSVKGKLTTRTLHESPGLRVTGASLDVQATAVNDGQGTTATTTTTTTAPTQIRSRPYIRRSSDRDRAGWVPAYDQRAFDAWDPNQLPLGEVERHAAAAAALQELFGPPPGELGAVIAPAEVVSGGRAHLIRTQQRAFWVPEFQEGCCIKITSDPPIERVVEYQTDTVSEYMGEYTGDVDTEYLANYWAHRANIDDDTTLTMHVTKPPIAVAVPVPVKIPVYRPRRRFRSDFSWAGPVELDTQPEIVDDLDFEPTVEPADPAISSDQLSMPPITTFPGSDSSDTVMVPGGTLARGRAVPTGFQSDEARIHYVKPAKKQKQKNRRG